MKKLKNTVEDVLSFYEERVESVGSFFDAAYSVLGGLQGSFGDIKGERETMRAQVQDILARTEHLRKKDFNNMMQGIQATQAQREKEVGELLKEYINKEKAMAPALRENLGELKEALAGGEVERVEEFQTHIKAILAEQEGRKRSVTSMLLEFQKQQRHSAAKLRELLARGNALRIKDLKLMVKEFGNQKEKRLTLQINRKDEVAELLGSDKVGAGAGSK